MWTIARVFANTAHDVNNALQAIAGNAELLKTSALDPAAQRRVDTIGAEAVRASLLINALQAYVRGERDPSPVVDLSAVTAKAVGLRTAALKRERIGVEVEPATGRPVMVPGPGSRLLQILLNLLLEAERVLQGKPTPRISVRVETGAKGSSVSVRALAAGSSANSGMEERAANLPADAQLWTARYLAEQAGASLTASAAAGEWSWTLTVPAAVNSPA